jgi:regulator of RNase E activity RraA
VRRRATLDSINKKITIDEIDISPHDLIFADHNGVVVIAQKYKQEVLNRVFENAKNERNILVDFGVTKIWWTRNLGTRCTDSNSFGLTPLP